MGNKVNKEKLLFRYHRGTLEESMKTVVEIVSMDHLKSLLGKPYDLYSCLVIQDVKIEPYAYDERIRWDSYIVKVKIDNSYYVEGFLNQDPKEYFKSKEKMSDLDHFQNWMYVNLFAYKSLTPKSFCDQTNIYEKILKLIEEFKSRKTPE